MPAPPHPGRAARFVRVMRDWRMTDEEVAFLLQADPEIWTALRGGGLPVIHPEARIRLGHCLGIAEAIEVLEPGADQADWIRAPHPILFGMSPHHFLTTLDDALRSIRWTMLSETRPGFPGYPANNPRRRPTAVDRAMALIRWVVEMSVRQRWRGFRPDPGGSSSQTSAYQPA